MKIPKSRTVRKIGWIVGVGPAFRRNRLMCNQLIDKARKTLNDCRDDGKINVSNAVNLAVYAAVLTRDINCMLARLWLVPENSERNLVCRHLALAIVEGLEDLAELNGGFLRDMNEDSPAWLALKQASRAIADLRNKYEVHLRHLRVTASAHRDKNAAILISSIDSVSHAEIEQLGWFVYQTLSQVMEPLPRIVDEGCETCLKRRVCETET